MPPSLVFDMHDSEPASSSEGVQKIKIVTTKRKATGAMAALLYKGVGPVSDVKEAFGMKLKDFAVIEYDDTKKRARAVLTAIGDGNIGAVPLTPNHEKAAVKAAYLQDQGTEKALVPWAKLPSMTSAAWLGAHMTISDALQEYTRPKPRAPKEAAKEADEQPSAKSADAQPAAKASAKSGGKKAAGDAVAMPTVVVPQVDETPRRVTPKLVKEKKSKKVVEESEDEIDLTKESDEDSQSDTSESEEECDTEDSDASTVDEAQSSGDDNEQEELQAEEDNEESDDDDEEDEDTGTDEGAETDDAHDTDDGSEGSDENSGDEADDDDEGRRPKKRRRVYEVVAKYLDDDRELTAKFKVHSKREMNQTFSKFRETGRV